MTTHALPADRLESVAAPRAPGRWRLAALVGAPLLLLVAGLVQVAPTAHDTASELESIAANAGRYQASAFLGFFALLLFLPALSTLASGVRPSRPRWASVGLALSVTGALALVSLMGSGPFSQALALDADRPVAVRVTDVYEGLPLTSMWMLLMLLGFILGPIVLGLGLWRAGHTWWVPALLVAGTALQMADAGRALLALGYLVTAIGFIVAAWSMASGTATARRDG